jgi:predicted nuclease of predicted toxin-antitoxin system
MQKELKFAVLIDGDNAQPSLLNSVLKEIREGNPDSNRPSGEIAIKRIYGDWTTNNMNGWKGDLHNLGIRPIQQFRYDNNATDGALMMDAIEIIHLNPRINAFCIVSSDSDFYNLALRIRENGLYVLGIGNQQTKEVFRKACNDFVLTNNLPSASSLTSENINEKLTNSPNFDTVEKFLVNTFKSISISDTDWLTLSNFGKAIKSEDPGFDPRSYGHRNLISLIKSYQYFNVKPDKATPPNYTVQLNKIFNEQDHKIEGKIKKFISYYGFIEYDSRDYYFHISNILEHCRDIPLKKGLKVKFNVFKEPNPGAESTEEKNGKASEIEILENIIQPNKSLNPTAK